MNGNIYLVRYGHYLLIRSGFTWGKLKHQNELVACSMPWAERSLCDCRVQFALVWLNSTAHLNSSSALTSLDRTLTLKWLLSPLDPLEQREGVTILTHVNSPINHFTNHSPCFPWLPNMFLLKRDQMKQRDIHSQPFA